VYRTTRLAFRTTTVVFELFPYRPEGHKEHFVDPYLPKVVPPAGQALQSDALAVSVNVSGAQSVQNFIPETSANLPLSQNLQKVCPLLDS
jgi:hypothetical protein